MAFNAAEQSGYQSTYGGGLGNIYQYGNAMPAGPYSFLNKPTAAGASGASGGSATSTSGTGAEAWLNDVLSGKNLPFSPFAQQQMLSQQSDMNAAAEGAQNQQLDNVAAAGGASANDPSRQSAKAGNMARRQTANATSARDISTKASTANFGAQADAASQLNQNQLTREGFQHGQQNQALGFMPWNQGGGQRSGGNNFRGTNSSFLQFAPDTQNLTALPNGAYTMRR